MDERTLRSIQRIVRQRAAVRDPFNRPTRRGGLRRDGRVTFEGRDGRTATRPQAVLRPRLFMSAWPERSTSPQGPLPGGYVGRLSSTLLVTVVNRGNGPAHNAVVLAMAPHLGTSYAERREAITLQPGQSREVRFQLPIVAYLIGTTPGLVQLRAFDPLKDPITSMTSQAVGVGVGNLLSGWSFSANDPEVSSWKQVPPPSAAFLRGGRWIQSVNCVETGGIARPSQDRSIMSVSSTPLDSELHQLRTIAGGPGEALAPYVQAGDVVATLDGWCWSEDVRFAAPRIVVEFLNGQTVLDSMETSPVTESQMWSRRVSVKSVPAQTTRLRTRLVSGRQHPNVSSGFDRVHLTVSHRQAIATSRLSSY